MRVFLRCLIFVGSCGALRFACGGTTTDLGGGGADGGVHADGSSNADGASDTDGAATDGAAGTDGALACPAYDDTGKACSTAADCTTVARGCYCGGQPVIGISKSIGAAAAACESDAAAHCALGCANFPGQVAEDGKNTVDGGAITVLCDNMKCHTVLQ